MKKIWQLNAFEIDLTKWITISQINGKMVKIPQFKSYSIMSLFIWFQNWFWVIVFMLNIIHKNTFISTFKLIIFIIMTLIINAFYYPFLLIKKKITRTGYYASILSYTWLCAYHYTDINSCPNIPILIYTIGIDFLIACNLFSIIKLVLDSLLEQNGKWEINLFIIEVSSVMLLGLLLYYLPSLIATGY